MKSTANTIERRTALVAFPAFETLNDGLYVLVLKRLFDILFAVAALIISAPILFIALLLIPMQSAGLPIFCQKRVGKNGKIFRIFKLRTMTTGSEALDFCTKPGDSRLTSLGRLLRATNIDELPQLLNVLMGDMSLIGPRPLSADETNYIVSHAIAESDYPGFFARVRPGLVGLEQINRTRDLTYLERFAYNEEYEQRLSFSLDAIIFVKALILCKEVCAAGFLGMIIICFAMLAGIST